MYGDDNRGIMPRGGYNALINGVVCYTTTGDNWSGDDFWNIYRVYLHGMIDPITYTPNPTSPTQKSSSTMRWTPQGTMICPSNTRTDYSRVCYQFFAYSTNDFSMRLSLLSSLERRTGKPVIGEGGPALWADRCNTTMAASGGLAETNHLKNGVPLGGNVLTIDGSVHWQPYSGALKQPDSYVLNGSVGAIAIPSNAIYVRLTSTGYVDTSRPDNVIWGVGGYKNIQDIH
jgi:hypothetical protein